MQSLLDFLSDIIDFLSTAITSLVNYIGIFLDFLNFLFTSFIGSLISLFNTLPYILGQGFLLLISIVFVMLIIKFIHVLRS